MSNLPLYQSICANLPKKDLTVAQKTELVNEIKKMSLEAREIVYVIIKIFFMENEKKTKDIPYNGKINKEQIDFDLTEFPIPLRQMLYKFMTVHTKKIKEDNEISSALEIISKAEEKVKSN